MFIIHFRNFKTPHVVQLIGVVSQGTPPYVLLEMMQNGSLKEYLHSLRASKNKQERRPMESVSQSYVTWLFMFILTKVRYWGGFLSIFNTLWFGT